MTSSRNISFHYFLFALVLCFCVTQNEVKSQKNIDSLFLELETAKQDTDRVLLLNQISYLAPQNVSTQYAKEGLDLSKKIGFTRGMVMSLERIAHVHYKKGNYAEALNTCMELLELCEKTDNKVHAARTLLYIGDIHMKLKNHDLAKRYSYKALEVCKKIEGSKGFENSYVADAYSHIGVIHLQNEDYEKALEACFKALEILEYQGDENIIFTNYNNIGEIYYAKENYDDALKYFDKAYSLAEKNNSTYAMTVILTNLGNVAEKVKDYPLAIAYYIKSLEIAKDNGYKNEYKDGSLALSKLYQAQKDSEKALYYYKLHTQMKDTIYNETSARQIAEIEAVYENEKKQEEIKRQQLVIEKRQNILYATSAVFVLLIVIAILIVIHLKTKSRKKGAELRQKLLRTQMNPHFIFNALSSIQGAVLEKKSNEAAEYISGFAMLMRLILEHANDNYISLDTEIKILKNYLSLQQMRYGGVFNFSVNVQTHKLKNEDSSLNLNEILIPPMLAQPFIENAIEHGIIDDLVNQDASSVGAINVKFELFRNKVLFTVENSTSKKGSSTISKSKFIDQPSRKKKKKHKPMAIAITKERLLYLNRGQRNKIGFTFSRGEKTSVQFNIPVKKVF